MFKAVKFCDKTLVTLENRLFLDDFSRKRGIIKGYTQMLCIDFSSLQKCYLEILRALFEEYFSPITLAFSVSSVRYL